MEITISGDDKKLLQQVEALAKRLGLNIKESLEEVQENKQTRSKKLYELMEEMAASGGITSIKDPKEWQRQVRKDKNLYGRY